MQARTRECPNCHDPFVPCPSTRRHQTHCSKPDCQRARKAKNNRRFRKKNPDYWKGTSHVGRTREWRREHPGYWRNEKRNGGTGRKNPQSAAEGSESALQVVPVPEGLVEQLDKLEHDVSALQAVSERQQAVIQELTAEPDGAALQAGLARTLGFLYGRCSDPGTDFRGHSATNLSPGELPVNTILNASGNCPLLVQAGCFPSRKRPRTRHIRPLGRSLRRPHCRHTEHARRSSGPEWGEPRR